MSEDKIIGNPIYSGIKLSSIFSESDFLNFPLPTHTQKKSKNKESNSEDLEGEKTEIESGEKEINDWDQFDNAAAAFLGPQLWDKTIPCKSDLKLEYMDLDEFLSENDIDEQLLKQNISKEASAAAGANATTPESPPALPHQTSSLASPSQQSYASESPSRAQGVVSPSYEPLLGADVSSSPLSSVNPESPLSPESPLPPDDKSLVSVVSCFEGHGRSKRKAGGSGSVGQSFPRVVSGGKEPSRPKKQRCSLNAQISFSPTEIVLASVPGEDFDPRTRVFSEDELKPQPMIKKNRKQQYIPNELKDDRYWARRRKNNVAAKRSRDARRTKENQIAMRASFLEKENQNLRMELDETRSLLESMKKRLTAYESV